jgi:hypothetical protein
MLGVRLIMQEVGKTKEEDGRVRGGGEGALDMSQLQQRFEEGGVCALGSGFGRERVPETSRTAQVRYPVCVCCVCVMGK